MSPLHRRGLLAAAGALGAAGVARAALTFGNPDEPPEGAVNGRLIPGGLTDPGPKNPMLA